MKEWVAGAIDKGFDSMAIMQAFLDSAMQISAPGSSKRSRLGASRPSIQPSSHSRCKIAEGVISDSE